MITRPYEDGDLSGMAIREECPVVLSPEWSWTIFNEDRPIAVFSVVEFWQGVGHIMGAVDDSVRTCGLSFTKESRRLMRFSVDSLQQYHRIQTYVFNEENARWARTMGLRYESTMKRASPDGKDVDIYCYMR